MAKKNNTATSLLQDMKELTRLLDKYSFKNSGNIELTQLEKSVENVSSNTSGKNPKLLFSTVGDGIVFHTSATGMSPNPGIKQNKLDLFLTLRYEYHFNQTDLEKAIKEYDLDLQINGVQKNATSQHFFEWHQDVQPQKQNGSKKYQFIHPFYHFHAGGSFLKQKGSGSLLQLSSPRLPHPPMDIVLAVNFILCNFYSTHETSLQKQMKILDDPDYQELVERAAKRVYKPYYEEVSADVTKSIFVPLITT